MKPKPKVVAVVGPTASGKTSLSIELAKRFSGEVVSADSRQVYKDLDIGTGKVTKEDMAGVAHHLIDMVEPEEIYTGNDFVRDAKSALSKITEKEKLPIVAGGTFFYVDLLRGKMQSAPVEPDQDFRASLEKYSNEELLDLLRAKDERRANSIDSNNRRRLIRAIEIINTLGEVPEQQNTESGYDWLVIGIEIEKEKLQKNFKKRLQTWLDDGLLKEVQEIRERLNHSRFLELGFEYTLVAEYLDDNISKEELFEKFVQKNWQYAKRQMTWLKRDKEVEWVKPENSEAIFRHVQTFLEN